MKSLSTNINNGNKHHILKNSNKMRLSSSSSSNKPLLHHQQRSNKTRHRIKPAEVRLKFNLFKKRNNQPPPF